MGDVEDGHRDGDWGDTNDVACRREQRAIGLRTGMAISTETRCWWGGDGLDYGVFLSISKLNLSVQ